MKPLHIERGGTYYRVCDPSWSNPADTTYSKRDGGRWNVAGEFGALYLNHTIDVAGANARRSLEREFGSAVTFADLRDKQRPDLQAFIVTTHPFVDAVTEKGIRALALPPEYPAACDPVRCQQAARALYEDNEAGIAARSAVAPDGEELSIFDSHRQLARRKSRSRVSFGAWYPGLA